MSDPIRIKDTLRHVGARPIAVTIAVILVTLIAAAFIGNSFYATEKKVLQQRGEPNAREAAAEYDHCLLTRVNIVTLVGSGGAQDTHRRAEAV